MENNLRTTENYVAFMGDFTKNNGGIKMNILDQVKELKNMIVLIEEELTKQEAKQEAKPEDFELYLRKDYIYPHKDEGLRIGFNIGKNIESLGYITSNGECYFLIGKIYQNNWEIWKENGFKVAEQEPVEWQGLKWKIDKKGRLCIVGKLSDYVYDFPNKATYINVTYDNDFLKKDSKDRIHLF